MLFFYPSLSPPQLLICLFLIISYFVIICTIIITKNNADHISTICVIPLMSSWNIYSIFFQSLLQIYSILKICYDILRYSTIPFLWRKMSVNLDFQRTFQYFQALYSVVRISSQLFLHNVFHVFIYFFRFLFWFLTAKFTSKTFNFIYCRYFSIILVSHNTAMHTLTSPWFLHSLPAPCQPLPWCACALFSILFPAMLHAQPHSSTFFGNSLHLHADSCVLIDIARSTV